MKKYQIIKNKNMYAITTKEAIKEYSKKFFFPLKWE